MPYKSRKQPRLNKNNKGVTLVEVIAVIAIMSVVMAAVTGFMITGAKMSAQVSGGATESMREQTAVEFINRRIWEAGELNLSDLPEHIVEVNGEKYSNCLGIDDAALSCTDNYQNTGKAMVFYWKDDNSPVALCPGEIYFEEITNDTVTYYLNGTKHVVHVRIASEP